MKVAQKCTHGVGGNTHTRTHTHIHTHTHNMLSSCCSSALGLLAAHAPPAGREIPLPHSYAPCCSCSAHISLFIVLLLLIMLLCYAHSLHHAPALHTPGPPAADERSSQVQQQGPQRDSRAAAGHPVTAPAWCWSHHP